MRLRFSDCNVLLPDLSADSDRSERFEREARAASALSHPNIVTVFEVGRADGLSYIAMEFLEGKTLRELTRSGPVPMRKLLDAPRKPHRASRAPMRPGSCTGISSPTT